MIFCFYLCTVDVQIKHSVIISLPSVEHKSRYDFVSGPLSLFIVSSNSLLADTLIQSDLVYLLITGTILLGQPRVKGLAQGHHGDRKLQAMNHQP